MCFQDVKFSVLRTLNSWDCSIVLNHGINVTFLDFVDNVMH